jgi:pimeloyl-ACP methyl ester carboxylesterase
LVSDTLPKRIKQPVDSMKSEIVEIEGLSVVAARPQNIPKPYPILFLHGMWSGAWMWEQYLEYFCRLGYHCYALNLRGRPGSRPVADIGKVSIHDYVEDARTVATALGNPILVGHSMGGLLAQKLAEVLAPPAVAAITPVPPRGIFAITTWPLLLAAARHSLQIFLGRPIAHGKGEAIKLMFNRLPPQEQEQVLARSAPESGRLSFQIAVAGLPVDAAKVHCPFLVIGAGEDNITPAAKVARRIARKYQADYREYPGFAHMIILEPGWERVATDIAHWLDRVTPGVAEVD